MKVNSSVRLPEKGYGVGWRSDKGAARARRTRQALSLIMRSAAGELVERIASSIPLLTSAWHWLKVHRSSETDRKKCKDSFTSVDAAHSEGSENKKHEDVG